MEIAIIGSGIGGLISALLLEKEGHQVTVYEKQSFIGGRLTFQTNGKYKIDQGPTIILLPETFKEILVEAGISEQDINMIPCEPLYDMHFPDGKKYTKYRDLPRQLAEIEKNFPGESSNYLAYLADMSENFALGLEAFLKKSFIHKRDFFTLNNMKLLLKSKAYLTVKRHISSYFSHTSLIDSYALQSLYIGGSPTGATALYGLVSYSEHAHGIWYLKGGYASLIPILERECLSKGIIIHRNTAVERIETANREVTGISVNNETRRYDSVIYNGDFPHLSSLLKDRKFIKEKTYTASSGCVLVYLGVTKRFPQANMHQFFMSKSFDQHMKEVFQLKKIPENPSFYVFNPVALDDTAAPPGESVLYLLIPVPSGEHIDWDKEKESLVAKVLDEAEQRLFKGLKQHIEWMDIRTPKESVEDGLYEGGSFGIAPTLLQSGGFRPQLAPYPIKRLYCVGASVHPGGGVPIVMIGARLLRDHIQKELST